MTGTGVTASPVSAEQFVSDVKADRRSWRLLMVPQFIFLFVVVVALAVITVGGFYSSVSALWHTGNIDTFEKAAKVFVTGSSSLLGFILIKLSAVLRESGGTFIEEERFFTKQINMARLAASSPELVDIIKQYHRVK